MSAFLNTLPFLVILLLVTGSAIILRRQVRRRLLRWLQSQGYQDICLTEPPFMRPGPFFMLNKQGWGVKRLYVRQADGSERSGWIMYPKGLFVEQLTESEYKVKLVWDDEWDPNDTPLWRQS